MIEKIYTILLCVLFLIPYLVFGISYFVKRYRLRHSKFWLSDDMFIQNGCVYKLKENVYYDAK